MSPSAPTRLESVVGVFLVDGLSSPSLLSPLPEWSSASRNPQVGQLLLGASRLLLVPDRPPVAFPLVLVAPRLVLTILPPHDVPPSARVAVVLLSRGLTLLPSLVSTTEPSSAVLAPPALVPRLGPPRLLWVNDYVPSTFQVTLVVVVPLVCGLVVRSPHLFTPR